MNIKWNNALIFLLSVACGPTISANPKGLEEQAAGLSEDSDEPSEDTGEADDTDTQDTNTQDTDSGADTAEESAESENPNLGECDDGAQQLELCCQF